MSDRDEIAERYMQHWLNEATPRARATFLVTAPLGADCVDPKVRPVARHCAHKPAVDFRTTATRLPFGDGVRYCTTCDGCGCGLWVDEYGDGERVLIPYEVLR